MKNPNGFGSVFKLSGKRRKPFGVRVTAGWELNEETGRTKQLYNNIGYYKTRQEAMIALAEYNKNPYDIDNKKVTFEEIYNMWAKDKFKDKSIARGYVAAFNLSEAIHHKTFIDIRKTHMQSIIDDMDKSYSTKSITKTLYSQLFKFALQNDIVDKDYSSFVEVGRNENKTDRKPFTTDEINSLWDNLNVIETADLALIMIYTGMRPSEMLDIETKNIILDERHMIGGSKTAAGKNRIIPLNKKIVPLIKKRMDEGNKYLVVNSRKTKMAYNTFNDSRWSKLMDELKMDHRPHDARHAFATLMDNAGANKLSIKKIMGHATSDITDKIYTHKNVEELLKAVDLI